eukprot:gene6272-11692_t
MAAIWLLVADLTFVKECVPKLHQHHLWLLKDKCAQNSNCEHLERCTTFHGSIVVRSLFGETRKVLYDASFPALREITGYLIVIYLKDLPSLSNLFPNLAVIRGQEQIVHYSLVIYNTLLERVILPSLTVIKSGGVRIDHNDRMCYIKTINWRSIVLDKAHTEENFGISFYKNNENCYNKCLVGQCYAPSGHDSPRQQHCFGPGSRSNPECQKLCKSFCGAHGCVDGTVDQCCHSECLGGCTVKESNRHCHACMNYRTGKYGFCVSQCPDGMHVVKNFECGKQCPFWQYWMIPALRYYKHNGHCVKECPAGYTGNNVTRYCDKCEKSLCPRECEFRVGVNIDVLSSAKVLSGCTVVKGNINIELRGGPSNVIEKLEEHLGSIQTVKGFIEIRESEALTSLSFFRSLQSIEPSYLLQKDFALLVFRNSNLKSLWTPKKLFVSKGRLLFHSNPYLCPGEIKALEKKLVGNKLTTVTESKNGYLGACNFEKFNITVSEMKGSILCGFGETKCVNVSWYHDKKKIDQRDIFYIVKYRMISGDTRGKPKRKSDDTCGAAKWSQEDVDFPTFIPDPKSNSTKFPMHKIISKLKPFGVYAFFVETYVLEGEGRKSDIVQIRLSESGPGRPLGLKASYLSTSDIEITWKAPDNPNGVITEYRIYYEVKQYSFWRSKLNWCSRDVTSVSSSTVEETQGNTDPSKSLPVNNGYCPRNITCDCETSVEESRRIVEDRNFALFNRDFEGAIIMKIFTKPSKDDDDDKKKKTFSKKKKRMNFPSIGKISKLPDCNGDSKSGNCTPKPSPTAKTTKGLAPTSSRSMGAKRPSTDPFLNKTNTIITPIKKFDSVDGKTLKYVIKDLPYFQEYKIKVCPCNKAGCRKSTVGCASVFGQTDANSTADIIPGSVKVNVIGDSYNVSWMAPIAPNGIVLRYDIRTKHSVNQERLRCRLGHLPTTLIERGFVSGNYSIRIRAVTPAGDGPWTDLTFFTIEDQVALETKGSNTIIIGVGSAAAFLIILLALAIVYYTYVRKTAQMGVPGVLYASVNPEYLNSNEVYIPDEWEVPREKIELIKELGKGSFGMVYEGIGYDIVEEEPRLRVAVKTVNENASIRDRIEFLQEASIMKAFNCHHIVRLLGVVSQGQPTLVVMELMERGDLKTFLRNRRPEERGGNLPPTLAEVLQMAAEIADGMSYLATRKFVHRDLAARNCMVSADFTVKIGDFGMTRDVYETDYYRKGGKGLLPVRWMAPESLRDGIFTTASDVWSYGVVLWEMATLAAQPYPGKSNEDVLRFVVDGGVLEQPDDCSDRLYNMMCNCWKNDPRARPSFLEVVQFLENDISETFEQVSFYHEMKRKLFEATETNLLKGPDQMNAVQVRRGSLKMGAPLADRKGRESVTSDSGAEENWKTEADRCLECSKKSCDERSKSMYDNDGEELNVRYVEMPGNAGGKSSKEDGKPVPV